ncbi:MAG: ThiF family adenylyltransferase [Brevinematales bacterium]|nr:ThiF family adenylyltransferase [Brevinematales bacterium]
MENWLLRTEALVGTSILHRWQNSRVMVVGLGGVGGMALEALARSGVGHFVVVDFDVFHPTNLNRQVLATQETLGKSKAHVASQRILSINPKAEVRAIEGFVDAGVEEMLSHYPVDFVIDAIDSLNPKVFLMASLWKKGIPFVSAMGAAARWDASSFRIGKLSEVYGCPLSRKVKQRLRRMGVLLEDISVVYSTEMVRQGQGLLGYQTEPNTYGRGRERIPRGSLAPTVMVAGLLCAQVALQRLASSHTQERGGG